MFVYLLTLKIYVLCLFIYLSKKFILFKYFFLNLKFYFTSIQHEVIEKTEDKKDLSVINTHCATSYEKYLTNYNENLFYYPKSGEYIVYTYDVIFYDSPIKWASRWDHYMKSQKEDIIHWFSIINSILIILIFSSVIALIFCRVLKKDIDNFNSVILKIFIYFFVN